MSRPTQQHLKLFAERTEIIVSPGSESHDALTDLCQAFARATGWSLRCAPDLSRQNDHGPLWSAPVGPGVGTSPGPVSLDLSAADLSAIGPRAGLQSASDLATAIGRLVTELQQTRAALREREAELAAAVPVIERTDDHLHVAERLEAVLRGGAQAVGCHAAAVYLLDSATTELKLRAAFGLPRERLALPPRSLREATADLEALAGHAVVMKNRSIRAEWNAPEGAAAALCVPVSTAAIPLGTLWLFSARERDFTDEEINLIEIVAGRLASDLEREVLVQEGVHAAALKRQVDDAERLQELQLPRFAPHSQQWDIDAWTLRGDRVGGDFYDWFPQGDDELGVVVGSAGGSGIAAAMLAGMLRTAVRAHALADPEPHKLLEQVNRAMWQAAAGMQSAALLYALIDDSGRIRLATAGDVTALAARPGGWQRLTRLTLPLARDPNVCYQPLCHMLKPEETLLLLAGGDLAEGSLINGITDHLDLRDIARLATEKADRTAKEVAAALRYHLTDPQIRTQRDRTLLVIKHRQSDR